MSTAAGRKHWRETVGKGLRIPRTGWKHHFNLVSQLMNSFELFSSLSSEARELAVLLEPASNEAGEIKRLAVTGFVCKYGAKVALTAVQDLRDAAHRAFRQLPQFGGSGWPHEYMMRAVRAAAEIARNVRLKEVIPVEITLSSHRVSLPYGLAPFSSATWPKVGEQVFLIDPDYEVDVIKDLETGNVTSDRVGEAVFGHKGQDRGLGSNMTKPRSITFTRSLERVLAMKQ